MKRSLSRLVAATASLTMAGLWSMSALAQGALVINANTSDPAPKAAFEAMVAKFEAENPDIDVQLNLFEHEAFKPAIRLFLMFDTPDVVTWFPGERMRDVVERGLFDDVSDLWQQDALDQAMASSESALTIDGRQWGVPYTDERVRKIFQVWQPLIEQDYFIDNANDLTWQEAQAPLIDGTAAMYLIGNFLVPFMEDAGVVEQIGFFPFPVVDPAVGAYEDAPTDTVHIAAGAANKDNARKFLRFIAWADNQAEMNQILGQLPANKDAALPENRFLAAGFEMLGAADGVAKFYDRDPTPEMA